MNANELAKLITDREGLKAPLSIAQVKEVLGIVADLVVQSDYDGVLDCIMRIGVNRMLEDKAIRLHAEMAIPVFRPIPTKKAKTKKRKR